MLARIVDYFQPPVFEDEQEKTRAARLLNVILLSLFLMTVAAAVVGLLLPLLTSDLDSIDEYTLILDGITSLVVVGLWLLLHRGYVRPVGIVLCTAMLVLITIVVAQYGGLRSKDIAFYLIVITIASLVLGGRGAFAFGLLSFLALVGIYYAQINGRLPEFTAEIGIGDLFLALAPMAVMAFLLHLALRAINEGFEQARLNAQALRETNRELRASRDELDLRRLELERRTTQLQAAMEVSRDVAAARDLEALLSGAVELVRTRFGFYHVGVFLVDERGEYAILRAATGEAGRKMLDRGHRLKVGAEGIVGYVTATARPRIALDTGVDAVHFDNPLLPETRSEMALPLRAGTSAIGALDVQSKDKQAFDDQDVAILQAMADQLAVAIQNARLLHETQRAMTELRAISGGYTEESWQAIKTPGGPRAYSYRGLDVQTVSEQPPDVRQAWEESRSVITTVPKADGDDQAGCLAVPMKLRDQTIGVLNLRFRGQTLSPEVVSFVEELASRLALSLENARLFEQTQRRAERERRIGDITTKVRASMDMETILETTVRELGAALGADLTFVRLGGMQPAEE